MQYSIASLPTMVLSIMLACYNSWQSNFIHVNDNLDTLRFMNDCSIGVTPGGQEVTSMYSNGLFIQHPDSKGNIYNVSVYCVMVM